MKILFLTNKVPWPLKDGGAIAVYNLSYGLAQVGCKVDILSINTKKHNINVEEIPQKVREKINIETVNVNTDIKPLKLISNFFFSKKAYIAERFYNKTFKNSLIKKLHENDYDIVIFEMLYLSNYIPVIREHSDAHISMRAPNIEHEIWEHIANNSKNNIKRIYLNNLAKRIKKLELSVLNTYDSLLPVSENNLETYKRLGINVPVKYITIGVFLDNIDKHLNNNNQTIEEEEEFTLAHIGALDWLPNIEGLKWFLDNVWELILSEIPSAKLYIAGRNAPDNADELFNKKNVIYLGEVENAYEFLIPRQILIVPLLSGSGMRVKITEGLALGKAIVSTKKGAEGIKVKDGQHLMLADDKEDFANSCIKLLKNNDLRKNLSQKGQNFIRENYDNLKIARNLVEFYKKQIGC